MIPPGSPDDEKAWEEHVRFSTSIDWYHAGTGSPFRLGRALLCDSEKF